MMAFADLVRSDIGQMQILDVVALIFHLPNQVTCIWQQSKLPYCLPPQLISNRGSIDQSFHVDDDSDLCVLEEMSAPSCVNPTSESAKLVFASHLSTSRDPLSHTVMGHSSLRQNDERFIYRVALWDLSQPKSEATPPDGLLAVPLLRHRQIALSWMGLGKTISKIALILKERSPTSKASKVNKEQCKTETLNLDEEDGVSEIHQPKQEAKVDGYATNGGKTYMQAKGRPPARTLIVCVRQVLFGGGMMSCAIK
ncbi:DNA-3-methyladenine glycosylase [Olea europaea subsp. europaea]|uniref:DNA-3-methyladenine glycosylase n=1 Tax=Olea europaea subsp. europaea TaxID=158383 RepID=A0A8S0SSI4_OLEEU|nr:DNA-3-methyladenine glycosylase [Olea europaea subsp. europaea]